MRSSRHTPDDLRAWARHEAQDRALATTIARRVERSVEVLREFCAQGPAYVGVSWGKDSVVVADLLLRHGLSAPLVWVRMEDPHENPESLPVRDAFLAMHPDADYREFTARRGEWQATVLRTWDEVCERQVLGLRNDESSKRRRRFARFGHSTTWTCAPISLWSADEVFAYHALFALPTHACYAMSLGGRLDRARLRVESLDEYNLDRGGDGFGRREWELTYFPEVQR